MKSSIILLLAVFGFIAGCTVSPKPIDYGSVGCHYCSMTIVDKQHAAQLVTKKGKVFNFDAIECMMNQLKEEDESAMALFLVNDFGQPGTLVDATAATYLISENIPSPMGEYLSAFKNEEAAKETMANQGGELFTWAEIKNRFKL
ncbi:nitrous oxide reductase accessory protein NosL [Allomuricauda sp. F6463D]|uniref:nitrous oxide reductase accessory protein NosL n=1 Tax=Allomuricauda sp. F6463D TaxID=2926409 RepID=UPI001FF536A8|nr:nitrous oxide reductase accessory protein NosL [Muricauda sp. F6463D]MCK0162134.1 nitrous oxide reductase accessory protein NosL [Muricauda sp. F6463D]